jgi:hypothetical protein
VPSHIKGPERQATSARPIRGTAPLITKLHDSCAWRDLPPLVHPARKGTTRGVPPLPINPDTGRHHTPVSNEAHSLTGRDLCAGSRPSESNR